MNGENNNNEIVKNTKELLSITSRVAVILSFFFLQQLYNEFQLVKSTVNDILIHSMEHKKDAEALKHRVTVLEDQIKYIYEKNHK